MELRDAGCRYCRESTIGNCGRHDPFIVMKPSQVGYGAKESDDGVLREILDTLQRIEGHLAAERKNWA
jgi:hypothetical protein